MSIRAGSATAKRLAITVRRQEAERRAARDAARRAGIIEPPRSYTPRMPKKASGTDHKTYYALKVQLGFVFALLLTAGIVRLPLYTGEESFDVNLAQQEIITMEDIQQTRQDLPPPPPPRPPVPIEVPDDELLDDDDLVLDATLDIDELIAEVPPPPPPPKDEEPVEEEPEIFIVVEEAPVMIGGLQALLAELKYPDLARRGGVEGRVTVQYVVDENGNVQDPFVLRGIGAGCDEEALRVIKLMKFEPGRQRGKPVKVQLATAVNFQLSAGG